MVGVPRSKGCRTCVQRRIKCDETRPVCTRCQKSKRECSGYGLDTKFQDEGPKLRQRFQKLPSPSPTDEGNPTDVSDISFYNFEDDYPEIFADIQKSLQSSQSSPESGGSSDGTVSIFNPYSPQSLPELEETSFGAISINNHTGFAVGDISDGDFIASLNSVIYAGMISPVLEQRQMMDLFSASIAPSTQTRMPRLLHHQARWLEYLPALTGANTLLDAAVRAVTLTHLGLLHNAPRFTEESRPYYGKALRLLNSALQDPTKGMASETLSSTILLSFYEMFTSSSNASWVKHAGGASTLMRLRGPEKHRTGIDRAMLLTYRNPIIIEAFEKGTPCFLDEPEWRKVLYDIYQELRNGDISAGGIELLDISEEFFVEMARLPGMRYDVRNMHVLVRAGVGDVKSLKEEMVMRFTASRAKLRSLHAHFETVLKRMGMGPTTHYEPDDPVFPVRYEYWSMFIGALYCGHWNILILTNLVLKELDGDPERQTMYLMENAQAARECCRSQAYMARGSFLGPFYITFALRISLLALEDEVEKKWIIEKLIALGNNRLAMAKEIEGIVVRGGVPGRLHQDLKSIP